MLIIKLGGSLLGRPELQSWLTMLVRVGDGRMVIVPGGSIFANCVRDAQLSGGYDDVAAHHMALLAMEQFGLVMQSLQPELVLVSSELEIAERSWQHRTMVWMPSRMVLADESIPKNWSVTSDSLSAWLARKLDAQRLVLVKHLSTGVPGSAIPDLGESGMVDQAFPKFVTALNCQVELIDKSCHADFEAVLAARQTPTRMT